MLSRTEIHDQAQPALARHKADAVANGGRRTGDALHRPIAANVDRLAADTKQSLQHGAGTAAEKTCKPCHFAGVQVNGVRTISDIFEEQVAGRRWLRLNMRRGASGHGSHQVDHFEVATAAVAATRPSRSTVQRSASSTTSSSRWDT